MTNNSILAIQAAGAEGVNFQPFMFMKPLQDAILSHQIGVTVGSVTSTLLFFLDVFIIVGIIATFVVGIYGAVRIQFNRMKARDETSNVKEIEANIKKEKKNVIVGTLTLGIIFVLIPAIVAIISAIVSAT